METQHPAPIKKTRSVSRKLLELALTVIIVFIVVEGGIVLFVKYTARPAKQFCASVTVNEEFAGMRSRAQKLEFNITERKATTTGEQRFVISKPANGESNCVVYVKDGRVSKKEYFLYLF